MHRTILFRILLFAVCFSFAQVSVAQCTGIAKYQVSKQEACDSSLLTIQNQSSLALKDVAYFKWDFGNGHTEEGDSNTNTAFWNGPNNNKIIDYIYRTTGVFNLSFIVKDKNGCSDTLTTAKVVNNVVTSEFSIKHAYNSRSEVCFSVKNMDQITNYFNWNFGYPPSGPENFESRNYEPCVVYPTGAYQVSLRMVAGSCDFSLLDTVLINGPQATIEAPYSRIKLTERYQCGVKDTVRFTNNSAFYRNDGNPNDEDSMVVVNGKSVLAFDYNAATRSGDQTALSGANHYANRTMGGQVKRLWDFGDAYASSCTTNTAKGQNVGQNCNYSEDEFPKHLYPNWEDVYLKDYYQNNYAFCELKYDDKQAKYVQVSVDTNDKEQHKLIFYKTITHNFTAVLSLKDTVTGFSSADSVVLVTTRPDASKLKLVSGWMCPSTPTYGYLTFDMNTGGQSYFAVNFDSLYSSFVASTTGGILAPPAPGSPLPFVLPYDLTGAYPSQFVKGYSSGEIGPPSARERDGSFTLGLVVGNGYNGSKPACTDTAWHHDIVRIRTLNSDFEVVQPKRAAPHYCMNEDNLHIKLDDQQFVDLNSLSVLMTVHDENLKSYDYQYFEENFFFQPYLGPSKNRNDSSVTYKGEDWRYNFIKRTYRVNGGDIVVLDTIVTSIIKDWKTVITPTTRENLIHALKDTVLCYQNLSDQDLIKLSGNLIDTSSISGELDFNMEEFRRANGDKTYIVAGKRFRYLNATKTDSIEVAQILHYRDTSTMGYDTLFDGSDTISGLWKLPLVFTVKDSTGKTEEKHASGAGMLYIRMRNNDGCESNDLRYFTTGLSSKITVNGQMDSVNICAGSLVEIEHKIRYWQNGEKEYPQYYPLHPKEFWLDASRYTSGREQIGTDWDKSDGVIFDFSLRPMKVLKDPGRYVVSVRVQDSMKCYDTLEFVVNVPSLGVNFSYNDNSTGCEYKVQFADSVNQYDGAAVNFRLWDFGDGTTLSNDQYPQHTYANPGNYDVKLKIWVNGGCSDSMVKTIQVKDGNNASEPDFSYSVNDQTLTTSNAGASNKRYVWDWGDNAQKDTAYEASHTYASTGQYNVCLTSMDSTTKCMASKCRTIGIGDCNALFGYGKDTSKTFQIVVYDSSTGSNLDYVWYWGDGDSSTTKQPSHDYTTFGKFLVTLKVSNTNCVSLYSDSLGMDSLGKLLKANGFKVVVGEVNGVEDLTRTQSSIYPNPTSGALHIQVSSGVIRSVEVFTMDGRQIPAQVTNTAAQHWQIQIDAKAGIYNVMVKTDEGWDVKSVRLE